MRKPTIWVYKFVLFDGELVFNYHLRARNAKCAADEMQKVVNRDFPDFDILYQSRECSAAKYHGKLNFPVYVDSLTDMLENSFNELYGEVEDGQTV